MDEVPADVHVAGTASLQSAGPSAYVPKAVVYRTNGDYAGNVPVRFDASRGVLVSYPAPSDLRRECAPVKLADGWLLDRLGVGTNTVYTHYTVDDYRSLTQVPSVSCLVDSIIQGSAVVDMVELPFTTSEAVNDTAVCNALIRRGFPGCRILKP